MATVNNHKVMCAECCFLREDALNAEKQVLDAEDRVATLQDQLAAVKVQLAKSQDDHLSEEVAFVQVLADLHEVHYQFNDLAGLRDEDRALLSQVATRWGLN